MLYKHEGPGLKPENLCKLRIGCASVTSEPLQGDGKQRQERGPASPVYAAASKQRPSFKRGRRPGLMPGVVSSPQTVASTNVHSCTHAHTPPSHTHAHKILKCPCHAVFIGVSLALCHLLKVIHSRIRSVQMQILGITDEVLSWKPPPRPSLCCSPFPIHSN